MTKKVVVGGIIAGLIIFFWSFLSHEVLPIGTMGIKTTPNEESILAAMKSGFDGPGFYIIPAHDVMTAAQAGDKAATDTATKAYDAKYKGGPWAVIAYSPGRASFVPEPRMLVLELLSDVAAGLILAWAVSLAGATLGGFGPRVVFVTMVGLLPWIVSDFSMWNWFGFPVDYAISQLLDQGIGGLLAGIFLAWWSRRE